MEASHSLNWKKVVMQVYNQKNRDVKLSAVLSGGLRKVGVFKLVGIEKRKGLLVVTFQSKKQRSL